MGTGAVLHTMQVLVGGEVYAHVARGLLFDGRALTLVDLAPSTIWASSTPTSALGYLPTGAFLDLWAQRAQHLAHPGSCRVRGTLSLLDPDAHLAGDAVLTLGNPRVTEAGLTYDADVLTGPGTRAFGSLRAVPRVGHEPDTDRRRRGALNRNERMAPWLM